MGRRAKVAGSSTTLPAMRPALTPEAREGQMISLAMDLVEQRLRDGTASSQETTHFLKLATEKERMERELMRKQTNLMEAKIQALQTQEKMEGLLTDALEAFKRYSGYDEHNDTDEY